MQIITSVIIFQWFMTLKNFLNFLFNAQYIYIYIWFILYISINYQCSSLKLSNSNRITIFQNIKDVYIL